MSASSRPLAPAETVLESVRSIDGGGLANARQRTAHACDRCRLMRTKCSGDGREPCTKCIKDGTECAYSDRKRERAKKDLAQSNQRTALLEKDISTLASALETLCEDANTATLLSTELSKLIRQYSKRAVDDIADDSKPGKGGRASSPASTPATAQSGEDTTSALAGSPRNQGLLNVGVDLGSGKGAVGYIGEMSNISWLQRIRDHLISEITDDSTNAPSQQTFDLRSSVAKDLSYFSDEVNLLAVNEDYVDDTAFPSLDVAVILSQACFHAMQGAFYFVDSANFLETLKDFPRDRRTYTWEERRWLATANMVWAIGDKWLRDTKMNGFSDHHLTYYARARALGLDHRIMFDHPDFERIQAIGLLAFYLFTNGSITRAWTVNGHAMRHAASVGMHLKVVDSKIGSSGRRDRARIFYSLYSLEVLLSEALGRPKSISLAEVTVQAEMLTRRSEDPYADEMIDDEIPLQSLRHFWKSFLQQSSVSAEHGGGFTVSDRGSWYFSLQTVGHAVAPENLSYRVRLCMISHKVSMQLYNSPSHLSWAEFQASMQGLETELDEWRQSLPADLDLRNVEATNYDPRPRLELAMYFHSVRMIMYRPFLCDVNVEHPSERSTNMTLDAARGCVTAATDLLSLLPPNPDSFTPFYALPWWSLLHHLCQAGAVLVLELCFGAKHVEESPSALFKHVQKVMTYLATLAGESLSAYKAWRIFGRLSTWVIDKFSKEARPMLTAEPEMEPPKGWSAHDESELLRAFRFEQDDDTGLSDDMMTL